MKKLDAGVEVLVREYGPSAVLEAITRVVSHHLRGAATRKSDVDRIPELRVWREWCDEEVLSVAESAREIEEEAGYPFDQRYRPEQQGRGGYLEMLFPWTRR